MFSLSSILRCQIGKPIATRHRHLSLVSTASLADVSTGTVYSVLRIFTFVKIDIPAAIMFNRIISLLALSVSPYCSSFLILFFGTALADGLQQPPSLPLSSASAHVRSKQCVIIGSGPVGLAAALTLSNPPHSYNVKVLDRIENIYEYNPTMAYHFGINPRGLPWFDSLPKVADKLSERASFPPNGISKQLIIPADPSEPIPPPSPIFRVMKGRKKRRCLIQRHALVVLLFECCIEQEHERLQTKNESIGSIQILTGKTFVSMDSDDENNNILTVKCADGCSYEASLVIGADGIDSRVRSLLADPSHKGWLRSSARKFRLKRFKSPSTGIKLKTLQFPPGMRIPNTTDSSVVMDPEIFYRILSVNTGRHNKVALTFFPMKDLNMVRPANVATLAGHDLWRYRTGSAMKEFYVKAFPRINFDVLVSDEEWDRFAKSNGTTFPYCQYSPGSSLTSRSRDTGVVLVGDACHAFPPDCGQGVNAGLQDVVALDRALRGQDISTGSPAVGDKANYFMLGDALDAYQKNRAPEHRALVQMAHCFAPYQYGQSRRRDQIGAFLWSLNVQVRVLLNKATFGWFPSAAYFIGQNHDLTFRQVMFRANFGTLILRLLLCMVVLPLIVKKIVTV